MMDSHSDVHCNSISKMGKCVQAIYNYLLHSINMYSPLARVRCMPGHRPLGWGFDSLHVSETYFIHKLRLIFSGKVFIVLQTYPVLSMLNGY